MAHHHIISLSQMLRLKRILASTLIALSTLASANTCNIVLPYPPSGLGTDYARLMQENNPDIKILQNIPGAFATSAISWLGNNKDWMMVASPTMYSTKNPMKNPKVEMIDLILLYGQIGLTNKDITFKDILTKPVNIAVPVIGGSQHLIALQLQKVNPQIQIIASGGGPQGLQLVVNKEVDMFITGAYPARELAKEFKMKMVFEIPNNKKSVVIEGVHLDNFAMVAVFAHTEATDAEKENIKQCLHKATDSQGWIPGLKKLESAPTNMTRAQQEKHLADYVKAMEANGL